MTDLTKWEHKDEWHQRGKHFLVVVKHYTVEPSPYDPSMGPYRWNVYAYIYPQHRLFGGFSGPEMYQPAARNFPLHAGPSFLRWHYGDDGTPTSVQVGFDYAHLRDDHFSHYATPEDAVGVFLDAEQLVTYLTPPSE